MLDQGLLLALVRSRSTLKSTHTLVAEPCRRTRSIDVADFDYIRDSNRPSRVLTTTSPSRSQSPSNPLKSLD